MGVFFLLLVTFLFERSAINDALVTSILRSVDPADVVSLSLSLFFSLDFFVPLHFSFFLCLFFLRRSVIWSHHRRERERKREAPTDGIECVAIKECAILKRSKRSAAAKKTKQKWNANRTSIKERLFFFLLETDRGQRFDDCFFFCVFGFSEDLARVFGRRQLGDADRWGRRGAIELTASPPGRSVLFLFVFFFSFLFVFRGAPLSAMVRGRSPAPCQASDFDWRRDASASRPAGRPAIANFVFVSRFAALDSLSPCRRNERDIESGFFSFSLGEASSHRTTL